MFDNFSNVPKLSKNNEENKKLLEKIEQLNDLLEDKNNTITNLVSELVQCNEKNRILEEKNKTYEEININLEKKVKELENLYEGKKNDINDLLKIIFELEDKNKKLLANNSFNTKIENEELTQLIMKLNLKEETIIESYKKLAEKEKIIEGLNLKLLNYPFKLQHKEKILSIILISFDESINYSMICKNTDNFSIIENKLYKKCLNIKI